MAVTDVPRVLVLGATGRTGAAVARELDAVPTKARAVRASRNPGTVARWREEGHEAVHIDLDEPDTFAAAFRGIDRAFLMSGYTSAMNHQIKTLVDAAEDAGVDFVAHLGVYGDGRSTDPHFAWHELVERYIQGSSLRWAHIHPHVFMENFLGIQRPAGGRVSWYIGHKRVGWIANEDIAAVVAHVLAEGPDRHAGRDYWLSTEVLDGPGVAEALSAGTGRAVTADILTPDDARKAAADDPAFHLSDAAALEYATSQLTWVQQTYEGRMDYSAVTTDTVHTLTGRTPLRLSDWAAEHREELLALMD